jgi:hypothetical protein
MARSDVTSPGFLVKDGLSFIFQVLEKIFEEGKLQEALIAILFVVALAG